MAVLGSFGGLYVGNILSLPSDVLPRVIAPSSIEWNPQEVVSTNVSPFTGQEQVYDWQASWWEGQVSFPAMDRWSADAWSAFILSCRGQAGTFLIGDPIRICTPPENVTGYSGPGETIDGIVYPSTITTGADGRIQNSVYVRWTQPNDANVVFGGHLEIQWQLNGASAWTGLTKVAATTDHVFIPNVTDGQQYNVQVRAVNCANVPSDWVFCGPITASDELSSLSYSGIALGAPGTLTAQGLSDGTAQITILPFSATVGAMSATFTPSPTTLTGLNQSQLYYVYFHASSFTTQTITPVATQNTADFEGRSGYYLISSIVTPSYTARYEPSRFSDIGSSSTINPSAAYDNDVTTYAVVPANWWTVATSGMSGPTFSYYSAGAHCIWTGFPAVTLSSSATLHVIASASASTTTTWSASINVIIGSTTTNVVTFTSATAEADNTYTIPSGTDLSTVSVEAISSMTPGTSPGGGNCVMEGFEIFIA